MAGENVNRLERFILNHIRFSVIFIYNLVMVVIELICWHLIPFLLSYSPNFNDISNKTGTSTLAQYIIILVSAIIISTLVFNKVLQGVDGWNQLSIDNKEDLQKIIEIRKKCMELPYKIFWSQIILFSVPVIPLMVFMAFLNNGPIIISIKIIMIGISLASIISVVLYAVYRKIFKAILLKTYVGVNNEGMRIGIKKLVFIQIIPLLATTMLIISLAGYSILIGEKEDDIYTIYDIQTKTLLGNVTSFVDSDHVMHLISQLKYGNTKPIYFYKKPDGKAITSDKSTLSMYLSYYIDNPYHTNRIFDLDSARQGIVIEIPTAKDGIIKAGIIFQVASDNAIIYYLVSLVILLLVNIFALYYVSKTLSNNISEVAEGLIEIAEGDGIEQERKIPATSNDEVGDLVVAFNKIRERQLEYDRLKTDFVTNISHELRTPINVIFTAIQLIQLYTKENSTPDSEISNKNLQVIKQNCLRLIRLINNLIDTTKIDAGYLKLQIQSLDIVKLVKEITVSVTEHAKSRGIVLKFDAEVDEKIASCDADKIETIILNLLSNAIKFTKQGGSISVKVCDKGDHVTIAVKDTGIGIPQNKQAIIFERFRQAEQSLVKSYEGSGIGLSLVKSLIEMHHGKIHVESKEGVGSEFIVELPVTALELDQCNQTDYIYNIGGSNNGINKVNIEFSDIYLSNKV